MIAEIRDWVRTKYHSIRVVGMTEEQLRNYVLKKKLIYRDLMNCDSFAANYDKNRMNIMMRDGKVSEINYWG